MIDLVYKTLLTIINKDNNGYISPLEFNLMANNVQNEIFRGYFEEINIDKIKENRGNTNSGYGNLAFIARQRIQQFAVEPVAINSITSIYTLPEDLYLIEQNGVVTTTGKVVEEVERNVINVLKNSIAKPTTLYPVYEKYANSIKIYPPSITAIEMSYLRKPKFPNWTYFQVTQPNGAVVEMHNPSHESFQDFELHESEFSNIVIKMLSYFGINLREAEIVQIAETLKDKMNLKDNG